MDVMRVLSAAMWQNHTKLTSDFSPYISKVNAAMI